MEQPPKTTKEDLQKQLDEIRKKAQDLTTSIEKDKEELDSLKNENSKTEVSAKNELNEKIKSPKVGTPVTCDGRKWTIQEISHVKNDLWEGDVYLLERDDGYLMQNGGVRKFLLRENFKIDSESYNLKIKDLEEKLRDAEKNKDTENYSKIEAEIKELKGESAPKTDTEKIKEVKEKIEKEAEKVTSTDKEKGEILSSEQLNKARELYAEGYKSFIAGKKKETNFFTKISRKVFGHTFKESEIPEELKKLETEYNSMIVQYGNKMYEDKKSELEKSGKTTEEQEAELKHFKNQDIFSEIIINEQQKLSEAKAENLPAREKAMFRKGLEWYSKQPKWKKIAISTALSVSVFALIAPGTVAAGGGILAYAGTRLGRAIVGTTVSQLAVKLYDISIKEHYTERKEQALEELSAKFKENMSDEEILQYKKEYETIIQKYNKEKGNRVLHKAMVGATAGGLASFGAGQLAHGVSAENVLGNGPKTDLHNQPPTEDQFLKTEVFKGEQVEFSSRGSIQTIEDLKEKLSHQYGGDITKAPQSVQEFLKTNSTQEAIKLGFFNPNDTSGAESAMLIKGSTLEFDNKGNLSLHDIKTGETHTLIQGNNETVEKYHGKMFDSDHSKEAEFNALKEKNMLDSEGNRMSPLKLNEIKPLEIDENGHIIQSKNSVPLSQEDMPYKVEKTVLENKNLEAVEQKDSIDRSSAVIEKGVPEELSEREVQNIYKNINTNNLESLTESGKEIYKENINKMFPTEESMKVWEEIKNSKTLSAERVMNMNIKDVSREYRALILELRKLQEVTELDPMSGGPLRSSETLNEYMMRTMAKTGDLGRLDEVKFDTDQLINREVKLEDNSQNIKPSNKKIGEVVENVKENVSEKGEVVIQQNENFKFITEPFKTKFSYDADGTPIRLSSDVKISGFESEALFKSDFRDHLSEWATKNNRPTSFEFSKAMMSEQELYTHLAVYENISNNPNYVKEMEFMKEIIKRDIKGLSKYGDIIDLEKLPKEFSGK